MAFDRVVKCETPFHQMVMSNRVGRFYLVESTSAW